MTDPVTVLLAWQWSWPCTGCTVTDDGSCDCTLGTAVVMAVYWLYGFEYPKEQRKTFTFIFEKNLKNARSVDVRSQSALKPHASGFKTFTSKYSPVNIQMDPPQIATEGFSSDSSSERSPEQHTKNRGKSSRAKHHFFRQNPKWQPKTKCCLLFSDIKY